MMPLPMMRSPPQSPGAREPAALAEVKTIGRVGGAFRVDLRAAKDPERAAGHRFITHDRRAGLDRQGRAARHLHVPAQHVQGIGEERPVGRDVAGQGVHRLAFHARGHRRAEAAGAFGVHGGHTVAVHHVGLDVGVGVARLGEIAADLGEVAGRLALRPLEHVARGAGHRGPGHLDAGTVARRRGGEAGRGRRRRRRVGVVVVTAGRQAHGDEERTRDDANRAHGERHQGLTE